MDTQLSPQVRLLAIAGAVIAVLGGGFMFVLNRASAADEPVVVASSPLPDVAAAKKAAPTPKAAAKPVAKPEPKPKQAQVVDDSGLPMSISIALRRHEVVVVSLFAPGGSVDELAVAEARAGAKAAGAGFVAVNVLDEEQGTAMARLVGLKEPPAVLVYRSPATLAYQFDGFADLDTVAQAAASAQP